MKPELQRRKFEHLDEGIPSVIKQWGKYDFKFKLQAQGGIENQGKVSGHQVFQKSLFQASILNAEAEEPNNPGFKIPIKCTWYRTQGSRSYKIKDIKSNVYQLSA